MIFYENGILSMVKRKFLGKYNVYCTRFMQYNRVISAITKFLKKTQSSRDNFVKLQRPFVPMLYGKLMLTNKFTRHIYKNVNIKI